MRYAKNTLVSVEKSKAEIEELLIRYGASQFISGFNGNMAVISFHASGRMVRFDLPLPDCNDKNLYLTPTGRIRRTTDTYPIWEQACRQRWRALALVVKSKLEAVECGITTFEEEFLGHIVLPGGKTIYQMTKDSVAIAYDSGKVPPMLNFEGDK